jgi:pyridoxine 4-dehydrogenase
MTNENFLLGNKIEINRFGYGAMQLTGKGVWGDVSDRKKAIDVLQSAVKEGVNFIDTSNAYGPDTNEILIAEALAPYKNICIATKGGLERPGPGAWTPNGKPEYISRMIDESMKRLHLKRIDLWQLHRVDPKFPIEETLAPVAEAVAAGKIQFVGLSEVDIDDIERAEKVVPIVSVQNLYNLGDRKWEKLVDYTKERGMAFIPWYPLASGPDKLNNTVKKIAAKHKATTAQIALAWLFKRSDNILLIPGTSSIEHLKENLGARNIELTEDEFLELSN